MLINIILINFSENYTELTLTANLVQLKLSNIGDQFIRLSFLAADRGFFRSLPFTLLGFTNFDTNIKNGGET